MLELRQVEFAYPDGEPVLRGVDLALGRGELVCVIGPNGAGKSTLLRLVIGLLHPSAGSVSVGGDRVVDLAPRERARRAALVPQELESLPEIDVHAFVSAGRYGHLGFLGRASEADARAVEGALAQADVAGLEGRLLRELSGGQRQRVLVARALAQEAPLLCVDEPTSSLDPEHQLAVFDVLARLTCEQRAVLVVTHDLNLASQYSTRVVLLDDGRVVADGRPAEVLRAEVLEPVYGTRMRYGTWPGPTGEERPFVVPWIT